MVYCTRCVPMIDSTLVKSLFTDLFMFTVQCVASSRRLLQNAEFFYLDVLNAFAVQIL